MAPLKKQLVRIGLVMRTYSRKRIFRHAADDKTETAIPALVLTPFDRPGVSQVILQVAHVVNGRLELRMSDIEFSVSIVGLIIRNDARIETRTIT